MRVLDRVAITRGLPTSIACDNGPEFVSRALDEWAHRRGVALLFIRPGHPVENCYVESFNGKLAKYAISTADTVQSNPTDNIRGDKQAMAAIAR